MKILAIGDLIGNTGVKELKRRLGKIKKEELEKIADEILY